VTAAASPVEPSFTKINYSIRPAKATQRYMLLDLFGRLTVFDSLADYLYVGFGSTFFVDFRLMHQRFGTSRMFSIERETALSRRFELNRPYKSVQMLYGESRKMLLDPSIPWSSAPAIVWLDYDEKLDLQKLADCERVLARAGHGSVLLVTFSAEAEKRIRGREDIVRERLGKWVPEADDDMSLDAGRVRELSFDALNGNAQSDLAGRGGEKVFRPLVRFSYSDGHSMGTWGGLILDASRETEADACGFERLPWTVAASAQTYEIDVPNLTPVERALIEQHLPNHPGRARQRLRSHDIPEQEVERLLALYRYAPRFVETFA
jgi:hypothetical protein